MYEVGVYLRVRRLVMVEGKSIREASRVFGLHRHAVRKMLAYSLPSGCRRQDLPDRDDCFVKACPAETTEAFLDGHVLASAFLGGVPQTILYDNTRLAVAKIPGDGRLRADLPPRRLRLVRIHHTRPTTPRRRLLPPVPGAQRACPARRTGRRGQELHRSGSRICCR